MAPTSSKKRRKSTSSEAELVDPNKKLQIPSWSSSAEEVAGNLDILFMILVCLPARYLVKFMSVCRQWRYLISEKRFHMEHVSRNPKPSLSGLYFFFDKNPIPLQGHPLPTFTFTGKPNQSPGFLMVEFRIHDSRHGLILCSYYSSIDIPEIVVCNPTTQKHVIFHQRGLDLGNRVPFSHFYLHFNPSISMVYKLVLIKDNRSHYEVKICASNCSTWKTIYIEAQQAWSLLSIHGFFSSDGIVYMMTEKWYLIQFDIETESLSGVLTTHEPKMGYYRNIGFFGERDDGDLVLITAMRSRLGLKIYGMEKREGRKWALKHQIDLTEELCNLSLLGQRFFMSDFGMLRMFWDGENGDKGLTLVIGVPGKAISYNHNNKRIKVICDLRHLPGRETFVWGSDYRNVHPFIGSLCPI